ncbi:venom metalloproteinase antarease-like TfasMP_A [Dermacentor albipictus]|uniref:venom metalloproteinase antarease-like TfasMP_A n=1 Tax=Dermacentor albipictus TaxID=60249 RepID=UPI0038FD0E80
MVQQTDGSTRVEGVVNRKLRIKPIPEGQRSAHGYMLHSLYEVQERGEEPAKMAAYTRYYPRTHAPQTAKTTVSTMTVRRPVQKFVVELFIISDQEHNQNFRSKTDLVEYLGIMVNAINLRYLDMTMPSIIFKLIGVTMSRADVFASHILGTIEAHETLKKLGRYYDEGNVPGNPDVVYLISNRDMSSTQGGLFDKEIAGLANVAGVCTNQRVAMGEDTAPSFEGVLTMAHELGHSLGARHDPRGSSECSWKHGFLMSYKEGGTNKYRLSPCSMDQIRITVEKLPDTCITESPIIMNYMTKPDVMPGQVISANEHCRLIMARSLKQKRIRSEAYAETLPDLARECKMKCCYRVGRQRWCLKVDILEGMVCTEGNTCRRGVCGKHGTAEK